MLGILVTAHLRQFVFAANGRLIQDYTVVDDAYPEDPDFTGPTWFPSCSTMLNGEAVIFGSQQVNFKIN